MPPAALVPIMAAANTGGPPGATTSAASAFVCPLCGTTFDDDRQSCTGCGGNLVVPVDDGSIYETILPLCGRPYDSTPGRHDGP